MYHVTEKSRTHQGKKSMRNVKSYAKGSNIAKHAWSSNLLTLKIFK